MSDSADVSLEHYRQARDGVVAALVELAALVHGHAPWSGAAEDHAQLERTIARLRDGRFVLAVVGEFSSGKSFLLNALLGKVTLEERLGATRIVGLLATDINPSTATITELVHASDERATAYYADGREERIPLDRLARFVAVGDEANVHDAVGDERGAPTLVRVAVDSPFLASGFVVADTPGLASINPAHRKATLNYLPSADAVLYLIDTQQPFSAGDASFLGIVQQYIESIFIIQTKIDLWRMRDGDRESWQNAAARIVAQAAQHAPNVPVLPVSAREYAQGRITGDAPLIARSGFPELLAALDASLVATTGRARLRRAAATARQVANRTAAALTREAAAREHDRATLDALREQLLPGLDAIDAAAGTARNSLAALGTTCEASIGADGSELRASLHRTLIRAIDIADIARLRDRAKLHIIIDDVLASAIGPFADAVAALVTDRLRDAADAAVAALSAAARSVEPADERCALLDALASETLPLAEAAAHAFGADASSGTWSTDLGTGVRSTIVLGALGGPAVELVGALAGRFAAAAPGMYMKRELVADLTGDVYSAFDAQTAEFVAHTAAAIRQIALQLGAHVVSLAQRVRSESLGAIERALTDLRVGTGTDAGVAANIARTQAAAAIQLAVQIEGSTDAFAGQARANERNGATNAVPRADRVSATGAGPRFARETYEHGLRPERWRVAVLGALRRGKSSLINALAGTRVLTDEGGASELRFPVHVRYGPVDAAYALSADATWEAIPIETAGDAAMSTPVLIETPWKLPQQLVLVHAPAFDSGVPDAEQIAAAAAANAHETLALFSRQLSDRELDMYAQVARAGRPLSFVHTLADNEAAGERRTVVALAERYLRERAIIPQRIFTISAAEYRTARDAGRAAAPWNELGALASTLATHAEEHMLGQARAQRERAAASRIAAAAEPRSVRPARSLLDKWFGRR